MITRRRVTIEFGVFIAVSAALYFVAQAAPVWLSTALPWTLLAAFWVLLLIRWRFAVSDGRGGPTGSA